MAASDRQDGCACPPVWFGIVPPYCPLHHSGEGSVPSQWRDALPPDDVPCEMCDDDDVLMTAAAWRRHRTRCPKESGK